MFQYQEDDESEVSLGEESEVEVEKESLPRKRQRFNMRLRKRLNGSEGMFNEEYSDSDFEDGNEEDASYLSEEEDIDLSEAEEMDIAEEEEEEDCGTEVFEATTIHETKKSRGKYKKWTSQDDEALRNSVNKYGYGYWEEIATEVQGATPNQCYHRWMTKLKQISPNPWKRLEDSKLRELVEKHGCKRKWTVISKEMKGRSARQCQERWREIDHKQPPSKNRKTAQSGHFTRWSLEDDAKLMKLVKIHGHHEWTIIAKVLMKQSNVKRAGKQCRERWLNHLAPNIKKGEWTDREDLLLEKLQKMKGNKWVEIAKYMKGRTENDVKNRFNSASFKRKQVVSIEKNDTRDSLSSGQTTRLSKYQFEKLKRPPVRNAKVDRRDRLASRKSDSLNRATVISTTSKRQKDENAKKEVVTTADAKDIVPSKVTGSSSKKEKRSSKKRKFSREEKLEPWSNALEILVNHFGWNVVPGQGGFISTYYIPGGLEYEENGLEYVKKTWIENVDYYVTEEAAIKAVHKIYGWTGPQIDFPDKNSDWQVMYSVLEFVNQLQYPSAVSTTRYMKEFIGFKKSTLTRNVHYFETEDDIKEFAHKKYGWVGPVDKPYSLGKRRTPRRNEEDHKSMTFKPATLINTPREDNTQSARTASEKNKNQIRSETPKRASPNYIAEDVNMREPLKYDEDDDCKKRVSHKAAEKTGNNKVNHTPNKKSESLKRKRWITEEEEHVGLKVKHWTTWTAEEDKALLASVKKHGRTNTGRSNWKRIAEEVPNRTSEQCQYRWNSQFTTTFIPWKLHEDTKLRELVEKYGFELNWTVISNEMEGRSAAECEERWSEHIPPNNMKISVNRKGPISSKRWSPEKDAKLVTLIKIHGKKWTLIAKEFEGKTAPQCRDRWCNHLDPNINKNAWTKEEDLLLVKLQKEKGNSWAEIAKCMNGRTDNDVKNRFNGAASIKHLLLSGAKKHVDSKSTNASTKQGRSSSTDDRNLIEGITTQSIDSDDSNDLNNITKVSKRSLACKDDNNVKSTKEKRAKNISREEEKLQLKGFPSKIVIPQALLYPISVDFIKNYDISTNCCASEDKMWNFMFTILKVFAYPQAPSELRSKNIWRTRAMRYLNYFSALILFIKYQDHDKLPEELRCDGIPPWWYVTRFSNHFQLSCCDPTFDNDGLNLEIYNKFRCMQTTFINWTKWVRLQRIFKLKLEDGYLDCSLDVNSERLYSDLQRFLNSYNRQYNIGAYDEAWFNKGTKKCTDEDRHDELKNTASKGLHHFEIALMETVFQAKPLIQDKKYKQFAALKIDSIDCGPASGRIDDEYKKKMDKIVKEKDSIIDAKNNEIERLKQQLAMNKQLQEMQAFAKDLQEDLQCPICFNPMKDPCIVPECCHRFCYVCIEDAIAKCGKECPICRARITSKRDLRRDELFGRIAKAVCGQEDEEEDSREKS